MKIAGIYHSYYSKLLNGKDVLLLGVELVLVPSSYLVLRTGN